MRPEEHERWKNEVPDEVFAAVAASEDLSRMMIYRGARVLARLLGLWRQSLDIDCCLRESALGEGANREPMEKRLGRLIGAAVRTHFAAQAEIRFELGSIRVTKSPRNKPHPAGLDGYTVRMNIGDRARPFRTRTGGGSRAACVRGGGASAGGSGW